MEPTVKATDQALSWLINSNIRISSEGSIARGGVCRGYDWQQRSYPYVYCEITGYALSMLVNAFRWTGDSSYLSLARESAEFLIRMQSLSQTAEAEGSILHSLSLPGLQPCHQYYSFDVAMCLQGLLDLYAVQADISLLEAARAAGDWLVDRMQQGTGSFLSMYEAGTGARLHPGDEFYQDGGCLHAKNAIGLFKLADCCGDDRYAEAARRVCDWVLSLQGQDGAFRANEGLNQVVSHPHCYAAEGLLYAYFVTGSERYLQAVRQAGRWLLKAQNRDGSLSIAYKQEWRRMGRRMPEMIFPRRVTDATSQAMRIWLALYYLDGDPGFLKACQKAENFLQKMQCLSTSDPNARGGFYFWPGHPILFTWGTMFAAHSLFALANWQREGGYKQLVSELF